ncbi:MAG: IS110 family transposase [Bacteroidia bacterium]
MKKNLFIGIDVSAATLDICYTKGIEIQSVVIKNQLWEINKWLKQFSKEEVILAMENTGYYNWLLYEALVNFNFKVYVIPPLHLKKSLGLIRGKNDKIDGKRIMHLSLKITNNSNPGKDRKELFKS